MNVSCSIFIYNDEIKYNEEKSLERVSPTI